MVMESGRRCVIVYSTSAGGTGELRSVGNVGARTHSYRSVMGTSSVSGCYVRRRGREARFGVAREKARVRRVGAATETINIVDPGEHGGGVQPQWKARSESLLRVRPRLRSRIAHLVLPST